MKPLKIFEEVMFERKRQEERWGSQDHDDPVWATILGEKHGDLCDAVLERHYGTDSVRQLENEIVQLAAICFAWLESMEAEDA